MRILLVEDHHTLARNIQKMLQVQDLYTVDVCFNGLEGLEKALHTNYDCYILDVMLPDVDGFTICAKIREKGINTPILLLTALTDTKHKVQGLDTGADDYLTKPFELAELSARIRALLRRDSGESGQPELTHKNVKLDPKTHTVYKDGAPVEFSPKEYEILEYLLRNKGTALKRIDIIEHVWGEREELLFSKSLDVHISYLRKKLGKDFITTVSKVGYSITDV